jgi:hypothetical protein
MVGLIKIVQEEVHGNNRQEPKLVYISLLCNKFLYPYL